MHHGCSDLQKAPERVLSINYQTYLLWSGTYFLRCRLVSRYHQRNMRQHQSFNLWLCFRWMFVEPLVISLANSLLHSCPEVWQYFLSCIYLVGIYSSSAVLCKHGAPVGCLTSLRHMYGATAIPYEVTNSLVSGNSKSLGHIFFWMTQGK